MNQLLFHKLRAPHTQIRPSYRTWTWALIGRNKTVWITSQLGATKYVFSQDSHFWAVCPSSSSSSSSLSLSFLSLHCPLPPPSISPPSPPFHADLKAGPWSVCRGLACFVMELCLPPLQQQLSLPSPHLPSFIPPLISFPFWIWVVIYLFFFFFHIWGGQNSTL